MSVDQVMEIERTSYATVSGPFEAFGNATVRDARIVVGNRIKSQCEDARLVSVEQACRLIEGWSDADGELTLVIGQGIDDTSLQIVYDAAEEQGAGIVLDPPVPPRRTISALTHKHFQQNIAITEPLADGHGSYHCALLLDERSADVSDHLTGRHIPGQLIAEAARQTTIAVTERFFLPPERAIEVRFVTHEMSVSYTGFILPLPIRIRCVPLKLRRASPCNLRVSYEMHFLQLESCAATAYFSISVVDRRYFDSREDALFDVMYEQLTA